MHAAVLTNMINTREQVSSLLPGNLSAIFLKAAYIDTPIP
jgi:hypothetical protein